MSVTITIAEQKFIHFLDEIRGTGKQCHVDDKCQEEVNKLFETTDKLQELKLTVDSKEVTYAGNFQKNALEVGDAIQNAVKNSPFYDYAINPEYKHIGVVIKAYKTGRIFFACVIRRDPNSEPKPQQQQNANPNQKKNKNKNKFAAYKAPNDNQKPKLEKYEDGRPKEKSVENLCVYLINNFLENNGKESLRLHQRAYNIMSKYHQESYANMTPLSRSNLLDIIKPFPRRTIGILEVLDPSKLDETYARNYFSINYIGSTFKDPMNCIAVSFQYNPTQKIGSIITFCGFDTNLPPPKVWNDSPLNSSKIQKSGATLTFFKKQQIIKQRRVSAVIDEINKIREDAGLSPLEKSDEILQKDAYNFVGEFAQNQAPYLKYQPSEEVLVHYSEAVGFKETLTMNDNDYVQTLIRNLNAKKDNFKGDFTNVAVQFFDAKLQRAVYVVIILAKVKIVAE